MGGKVAAGTWDVFFGVDMCMGVMHMYTFVHQPIQTTQYTYTYTYSYTYISRPIIDSLYSYTYPYPYHQYQTAAALSTPERVAGLVVMDIAPVTYSITDGTNWQDTHKVRGCGCG
jgi:hypothetical protein